MRGRAEPVDESEPCPSGEHAVSEAEPFDEISAVKLMDKEQDVHRTGLQRTAMAKAKKKKRVRDAPDSALT